MTTSMVTLGNAPIPSYLVSQQPSAAALAIRSLPVSAAVAKISIKQSRFRIVENNVETPVNLFELPVVVIGVVAAIIKTFYAKNYTPGDEPTRPDCASTNGTYPDRGVPSVQATQCVDCPKNQWGSKISQSGNEVKACADSMRLAVVAASAIEGTMYRLDVPATSMKDLRKYAQELERFGLDLNKVITLVSFDSTVEYPKLVFKFGGYLSEEQYQSVLDAVGDPELIDVLGTSVCSDKPAVIQQAAPQQQQQQATATGFGAPAQQQQAPAQQQAAPQQQAPVQQQATAQQQAPAVDTNVPPPQPKTRRRSSGASGAAATQQAPAPQQQQAPATGFGAPAPQQQQQAPATGFGAAPQQQQQQAPATGFGAAPAPAPQAGFGAPANGGFGGAAAAPQAGFGAPAPEDNRTIDAGAPSFVVADGAGAAGIEGQLDMIFGGAPSV